MFYCFNEYISYIVEKSTLKIAHGFFEADKNVA